MRALKAVTAASGTALLLLLPLGLAGCATEKERPQGRPTATYELPPRPVRDGETAVRTGTVRSGDIAFTVIGFRAAMPELVGSHADMRPRGAYARARLVIENLGRTTGLLSMDKQLLVGADGRAHRPDQQAMLIKRQPLEFELGAAVRLELDLWYDLPAATDPAALRLFGTPGVGAVSDPPPVEVKLP